MIIALIGDLEGDRDWAVSRLRALGERGDVRVACQLGDLRFGMGPDHEAYLAAIEVITEEHVAAPVAGGHAHGHFHVAGEAVIRLPGAPHDTTVWSLGANGDPANVRLLDLEALADANPQGR